MKVKIKHSNVHIDTLGVASAVKGSGGESYSWLAVAAANYLTGVKRKKVAVVDMSEGSAFEYLARYYDPQISLDAEWFELYGVRYYFHYDKPNLPNIMNGNFEYIIFNCGKLYNNSRTEYLRCQKKILAGSIKPWEMWGYKSFLEGIYTDMYGSDWHFLADYFDEKDKRIIEKAFRISITQIPVGLNPFQIKRTEFSFFDSFL